MLKKKYLLFLLLISASPVNAQDTESEKKDSTGYFIQNYSNRLSIKTNLNTDIEFFRITSPNSTDIDLIPNITLHNSYNISYKFIIFSLSIAPQFLTKNSSSVEKGETTSFGLSTNIGVSPYFNQLLSFKKVQGYYLSNTSDFNPNWVSGDPYILFPKLNYLYWQGVTTYKTNINYSMFASNTSYLKQIKTAGSFLYNLSYRFYKIDDRTFLTGTNSSQKSGNLEIIVSSGYAFTYVFKENFFFTGGITPGIGLVKTKLTTRLPNETIETFDISVIYSLENLASIGYDNGRFFTGTQVRNSITRLDQENRSATIFDDRLIFEVYIGYRFNAPEILKRSAKFISDTISIQ